MTVPSHHEASDGHVPCLCRRVQALLPAEARSDLCEAAGVLRDAARHEDPYVLLSQDRPGTMGRSIVNRIGANLAFLLGCAPVQGPTIDLDAGGLFHELVMLSAGLLLWRSGEGTIDVFARAHYHGSQLLLKVEGRGRAVFHVRQLLLELFRAVDAALDPDERHQAREILHGRSSVLFYGCRFPNLDLCISMEAPTTP